MYIYISLSPSTLLPHFPLLSPQPCIRRPPPAAAEAIKRARDGHGASSLPRRRPGRLPPLLLPLVLLPRRSAAAPTRERGGAEADAAGDDAGAGCGDGGAEAQGAEHRQAGRPGPRGGQGARRRAGPAAEPPPPGRPGGGGCCCGGTRAAARHVQRHRLRLQPRLVSRRPLLRSRHLRRQALQAQPSYVPGGGGGAQAAVPAWRWSRFGGRRRAGHARQQEAPATQRPPAGRRHGGGASAAEPARRGTAPAVAQPAHGARSGHAAARRRPRRVRRCSRGRRRRHAGIQRLHEAAYGSDHVHAPGDAHTARRQLLAGLHRQAAEAALTAPGRRPTDGWAHSPVTAGSTVFY